MGTWLEDQDDLTCYHSWNLCCGVMPRMVFHIGGACAFFSDNTQRPHCRWKTRMTSCCVEKPKIKELRAQWHHTPSLRSQHFLVEGIRIGLVESTFHFYFILYLFASYSYYYLQWSSPIQEPFQMTTVGSSINAWDVHTEGGSSAHK